MNRLRIALTALALALTAVSAAWAAPAAPKAPDLDSDSDSGAIDTDNITNDATPTFTITAGSGSLDTIVTLCYRDELEALTVVDSVAGSAASVEITAPSAIADGTITFSATTGDTESCTPSSTISQLSPGLSVTIDTVAPVISLEPILLEVIGGADDLTNNAKPFIGVDAKPGDEIELFDDDGDELGGATAEVDGYNKVKITTALSDGEHTIYAKATDKAGNTSAASPTLTFSVDTKAPTASTPDLLAADDDGESATDNRTTNPRPRFTIATEAGARVTLFENGIALGSAIAGSDGNATVAPGERLWLDPGEHCLYVVAWDTLANASAESSALCVTVLEGGVPFTTNLGVALGTTWLRLTLRPSVNATATVRVLRNGKLVAKTKRAIRLQAGKPSKLGLKLPLRARNARKLVVVATLRSNGRTITVRRVVTR